MIRPLRRRHRWLMPGLLLLLAVAAVLALANPPPSPRVDVLPPELTGLRGSGGTR